MSQSLSQLLHEHGSVRKLAKFLDMPRTTLRRKLKAEGLCSEEQTSDAVVIKDALTAECERLGVNPAEVTRGWLKSEAGTIQIDRKKQSKLEVTQSSIDLLDSARRVVLRPSECSSADSLLVISLHDAHFGKLAYRKEAGEDYDPSITSSIYRQAVSDTLAYFNPNRIKKIIFPIGSDMLHVDNLRGETTAGTRVDSVDTRLNRVFDIACASVISAIEDCLSVADVDVIWIPGNHDETISGFLAKNVKTYFRFDSRVFVDDGEASRKSREWGTNLLLYTHRFSNHNEAPNTLATECPHAWSRTTCREIHTGDKHRREAIKYIDHKEHRGVVVRILPSISATDKWHFDNQFTGNLRAAESYQYLEDTGMCGSYVSKVRM